MPCWWPCAGPLLLVSTGGGFTSSIPLPTRHTTLRLTPGAWSPNGKLLAMAGVDAARPARDGVYSMSVNGGDLRRLTTAPRGRPQRPLAYSPDGRSLLLFQRDHNGRFGTLYVTRPRRPPDEGQPPGGGDLLLLRIAGQLVSRQP